MTRTRNLVAAAASVVLLLGAGGAAAEVAPGPTTDQATSAVTTWAASDDMIAGTLSDVTVRNVVHTSIGGSGLRIRLSNTKGGMPVTFDSVYVGVQDEGAAIVAGSNQRVTFGDSNSVVIPPGATALSDPLPGTVEPQQKLAVSIHVAGGSGKLTAHNRAIQHTYQSTSGDHAADESASAYQTRIDDWIWLDAVVVEAPQGTGTVATLGDSITAGVGTTINTDRRWPDVLADRFSELAVDQQMGVANEGISKNRVLRGISTPGGPGDSALARLESDVLTKPGVETVLLFEGVNDIGAGGKEAAQIIAGYKQIIARTKASGRCIVGATILPFAGSVVDEPGNEQTRQAVNEFIRDSGEFDAVVDFDAATRDPQNPARLRPDFHNGDALHPNDAGNAAMAAAIDLDQLRCG